jgi:pyruvate,orthophosphate dikinase
MVFGNMGDDSATGVAFTRNPSTGENALYGEYLINAQGEDVVAGIRTPQELTEAARDRGGLRPAVAGRAMPDTFAEFTDICDKLENTTATCRTSSSPSNADKLWMLQTRSGKRTTKAALKIAVDMVDEGLITPNPKR